MGHFVNQCPNVVPGRAGEPWLHEEDEQLLGELERGATVEETDETDWVGPLAPRGCVCQPSG